MTFVSALDWWVIGIYLVGIILFGVWLGRGQKNVKDYFLGSKNLPWWGVGLSIVATETSALTFIGIPAQAYSADISFIQIVIGYVVARLLLAWLVVPYYFRGEIYSPYELFARAFGPGARRAASLFFLVSGTLAAGVRVYVTSIPIELMLGIDIFWAIALFIGLSLIYTYVGGIKAVVWTDAIQFILFLGGGLFALMYIPTWFAGDWPNAWAGAVRAGKLHWFNPEFSLGFPFNIWMGLIGATVLVLFSHGADQLIVQRVLTCRSAADGRKSLILSAAIIFPLLLMFLVIGTFLWIYYQRYPFAIPLPEAGGGLKKDDYVFPIFILTALPAGLKGFLIVAILSAAMSSVSSALSALASVLTMDLIPAGWLRPGGNGQFQLRFSKCTTLFWALVLIAVASLTQRKTSILNLALSLTGLTSGALLGGLILSLTKPFGRPFPVIAGMIISFVLMTVLYVSAGTQVAWPWYTLAGTLLTVMVAALLFAWLPARSEHEPPQGR